MISHDKLKEILQYDAETGEFRWKVRMGCRALQGARAGTTKEDGYRILFIERKRYAEHRLAWFYAYGRWLATIKKDGVQYRLGHYRTAETAHAAYVRAAGDLHGQFARTQ